MNKELVAFSAFIFCPSHKLYMTIQIQSVYAIRLFHKYFTLIHLSHNIWINWDSQFNTKNQTAFWRMLINLHAKILVSCWTWMLHVYQDKKKIKCWMCVLHLLVDILANRSLLEKSVFWGLSSIALYARENQKCVIKIRQIHWFNAHMHAVHTHTHAHRIKSKCRQRSALASLIQKQYGCHVNMQLNATHWNEWVLRLTCLLYLTMFTQSIIIISTFSDFYQNEKLSFDWHKSYAIHCICIQ